MTRHPQPSPRPLSEALLKGAVIGLIADVIAVVLCFAVLLAMHLIGDGAHIWGGEIRLVDGALYVGWLFVVVLIGGTLVTAVQAMLAGVAHALILRRLRRVGRGGANIAAILGAGIGLVNAVVAHLTLEWVGGDQWALAYVREAWYGQAPLLPSWQNLLWGMALLGPVGIVVGALAGRAIDTWMVAQKSVSAYRREP